MGGSVSVQDILVALDQPVPAEKTASHTTDEIAADVANLMEQSQEKTASEVTHDDLEKIAKEVISSQDDVLMRDAQLMGAAIRDGFEMRGQAYQQAFTKTAEAEGEAQMAMLMKFAQENPELWQEAVKEGARDAYLLKEAAQEESVSKTAFMRGYWDAQAIFDANEL